MAHMANFDQKLYTIEEYLDSRKTPNGGYTKDTLREFGVSWPPPKGWKKRIIMAVKQNPNYNSTLKVGGPVR